MVRAVIALLVAVLASSSVAPLTGAGWESAPAARMACCQRAAHDCSDRAANANWIAAPFAVVAAIAVAPDVYLLDSRVSRPCEASAAPRLHARPARSSFPSGSEHAQSPFRLDDRAAVETSRPCLAGGSRRAAESSSRMGNQSWTS